jgi:hypothetical protein
MSGNYLDLHLTSRIARTRDLSHWEVVAATSDLPPRVFYGAVVHHDKIWLLGGFDGRSYYNDVWNTADGVHWTRVAEHAAWTPRNVDMTAVFRDRIWVIGGGLIDGTPELNTNSKREVWSSGDGVQWVKHPDRSGDAWGGTPVVYADQLWLIAANRNSTFAPALLATGDGSSWREESAPWPPRGAPAVWVFKWRTAARASFTGTTCGRWRQVRAPRPARLGSGDPTIAETGTEESERRVHSWLTT